MPNWCSNHISLTHDDPAMIKKVSDNYLAPLTALVPQPESIASGCERLIDKDTSENWYDWRIANWGTKWDIELENIIVSSDGKTLTANFASAWSPPIEAYEKLKEQGYKISAFYSEMMMGFAGRFEDGMQEFIPSVNFEKDNWREGMSDELADYLESDFLQWQDWTDAYAKEQARMDAQRDPLDNIEQELWYDTSAELE